MSPRTSWDDGSSSEGSTSKVARATSQRRTRGNFAADPDDSTGEAIGKFVMRNLLVIITAIVAVSTLLWASSVMNARSDTLKTQEAEILQLQQNVESSEQERSEDYVETMRIVTDGMDVRHRESDDAKANALFKDVLTWDGLDGYLAQRDIVRERYSLSEDSDFMTNFMPGEKQGVIRRDASGELHTLVDEKVRSEYEGMRSFVTGINGDVYDYLTFVQGRTRSDDGQASVLTAYIMRYSVIDGKIVNLTGQTIPVPVQRAG